MLPKKLFIFCQFCHFIHFLLVLLEKLSFEEKIYQQIVCNFTCSKPCEDTCTMYIKALWCTDQALKNILGTSSICAPSKLQAGRTTRRDISKAQQNVSSLCLLKKKMKFSTSVRIGKLYVDFLFLYSQNCSNYIKIIETALTLILNQT